MSETQNYFNDAEIEIANLVLAGLNNLVNEHSFNLGDNMVLTPPEKYVIADKASKGVNKVVVNGRNIDCYLDDSNTRAIADGASGAAVAATFIPDPTVCKVVAAVLAIVALVINHYNKNGRGVIVSMNVMGQFSGIRAQ